MTRIQKFLSIMIVLILFIMTGCSAGIENEEQKIEVQKRVEGKFEDFREVTDFIQVSKVKEVLDDTVWKNAKVDMSRPPDYQFVFQFKNPEIATKAVLHQVWISPNKDKLEIVQGDNQYAQKIIRQFYSKSVREIKLGFTYDCSTRTYTTHHHKIVQNIFVKLFNNEKIYKKEIEQAYCNTCEQFLPDRFVEGVCPNCGKDARGDQCDHCSKILTIRPS